jgi:hypothetical protein
MFKFSKLLLPVLFCLSWAAASQAVTTLTLTDCDPQGCRGADLKLEVEQQGSNFLVTYTIDTTTLDTGGQNQFIGMNQIGFLAIKDWTDVQLLSAPNGTGNWTDPIEAVIHSNSLCELSNGDPDKVCSSAQNSFLNMTNPKGEYEFEFLVIGGTLLPTSEWHFSGQWCDHLGECNGAILSVGGTPSPPAVPEPSAALLFAVGAVTVGRSLRRRA